MIIQCEQCQTKFKLDDSKVADKSIKVRCARCKHVFTVDSPPPAEEPASLWEETPLMAEEREMETAGLETAVEFDPESTLAVSESEESAPLETFSFDSDEEPQDEEPAAASAPEPEEDDFSFPAAETPAPVMEVEKSSDDLDFGDFDFGSDTAEETPVAEEPLLQAAPAVTPQKEVSGLDFSDDDMFGEIASAPEEEEETIAFDMGMDDFADSMGESTTSDQDVAFGSPDKGTETPFSLDDLDFGDELTSVAVQQVSPEELQPSKDVLFAPVAAAEPQFSAEAFEAAVPASPREEAPAPVSRLKEKPRLSGMLLMLWVMIIGLVAFYGVWGFKTLTDKGKEEGAVTQEAGRISVRGVEATYVKNKKLGNLLVIKGEAVNEYNKPRAAIQVKGLVFGANGDEVASKIAFCGNPLTDEQIATMSMDKIEAAMANQFGDSLANMEVAAGDAIPFVIVIPAPPAGATDYGVEPAGSTVASAKEKEK